MLFQQINNEALDEDRKADLEVIRRLKKNYEENKEAVKQRRTLDQVQKNAFIKELSLFEKYIYKTEAFLETTGKIIGTFSKREAAKLLSDVVITYNALISFLGKIGYSDLEQIDKTFIKNKINGNLPAVERIIAQLYEKVPDFVLLPISNIADDMKLSNYRIQSFTDEPELEFMRDQKRRFELLQEQDDRNRPVQDDDELFEFDAAALRRAIQDYATVNPNVRLDTQEAFEDVSSAFTIPPTERQYMDALAQLRPRNRAQRQARNVAIAQQEVDDEMEGEEDDEMEGMEDDEEE
jgi:hypothetical protein